MAKKPQVRNADAEPVRVSGKFAPGSSGNPGGQPKWLREFRDAFGQRCAPKAEEVLNRILDRALDIAVLEAALEDEDVNVRLAAEKRISERMGQAGSAADTVLKYVLPKPTQQVEVTVPQGAQFAGLSPAELLELAKQKPKEEGET